MKSRSGFVSNSSSSSFIVGFDTKPKSAAELCRLLFGDMEFIQYYDKSFSTAEIANIVFNDLKGQRCASPQAIIKTVKSGYYPGRADYWGRDNESDKLETQFKEMFPEYNGNYWDETKITKIMAKQLATKIREARKREREQNRIDEEKAVKKFVDERIISQTEDKKVYILEYADEDGQAVLEHGGIFENLPHVQISHH